MPTSRPAFRLPGPLQHRVEALLDGLLRPPGAHADDFTAPPGEPALCAAGSAAWQVFRNPVTVFVGGVAAVVLELAEPRVRAGVWQHTRFREEPLARMGRTGYAAMLTVYGPRSRTEALIAGVNRRHASVTGTVPGGGPYRADDPALLAWVQATASYGFLQAYVRLARPLDAARRDAFYADGLPAARLYGAHDAPATEAALEALFERWRPLLEPSPVVHEFLGIVARMPALPAPARPLQRGLVVLAVECLPDPVRTRLGLGGPEWTLSPVLRAVLVRLARGADRLALATHPGVQACRRLGLPADALYEA